MVISATRVVKIDDSSYAQDAMFFSKPLIDTFHNIIHIYASAFIFLMALLSNSKM